MSETPKITKPKTSQTDEIKKDNDASQEPTATSEPVEQKTKEPTTGDATEKATKESTPAAPAIEEKPQPTEQPAQKSGGGRFIATVALLVAIGTLAGGYQVLQQTNQTQAGIDERLDSAELALSGVDASIKQALGAAETANNNAQASQSSLQSLQGKDGELQQSIDTINTEVSGLSSQISSIDNRTASEQSTLSQQLNGLSLQVKELQLSPDFSKTDWLIAETQHLIKMANHQAQLAGNAVAAAAALESANARLGEIGDPSLVEVRKLITDKIIALRGAPQLDYGTVAMTISSLEKEVENLPLKSTAPTTFEAEANDAGSDTEVGGIESFFDKVWSDVKSLVTIRKASEDVTPALLPPGQQFFLQQNLRLKLEASRIALLQRDTEMFQTSIKTAQNWIERYFDVEAAAAANMLTTLSPYESMDLSPSLPDAGDALKALEAWANQRTATAANQNVSDAMEVSQL